MKKNNYLFIAISVIITAIIIIVSSYCIYSIVDKSTAYNTVCKRFDVIKKSIDTNNEETDKLIKQCKDDGLSTARGLAMILNKSDISYYDTENLEEIRVAIMVDEIIIINRSGMIIAGTNAYFDQDIESEVIFPTLKKNLNNSNYQDAIIVKQNGNYYQYCIVTLNTSNIKVIIKKNISKFSDTLSYLGLQYIVKNNEIFKTGQMAILDPEKWSYESHTDSQQIGQISTLPRDEFDLDSQKVEYFDVDLNGTKTRIYYLAYENNILICSAPHKEIFLRRTHVYRNLTFGFLILITVCLLAVRTKFISMETKNNK